MVTIKSYSNVWSVQGVLYSLGDVNLPFPIPFQQIGCFVVAFVIMIALGDVPPLSFIDNDLVKLILIPAGLAWFMYQKSFDGKSPVEYLRSVLRFLFRPKITYGDTAVKRKQKIKIREYITIVRDIA